MAGTLMAGVTSQTLRPTLNPYYQTVEDAQTEQPLMFVGQFNTVESPIVGLDTFENDKTSVIQRTSSLQFGGSWLVSPQLQIGSDFGMHVVQMADGTSYFGFSDLHFMAKRNLWQKAQDWGLSVAPDLYIPIHNRNPFMSNGNFGFGARLFFEKNISHLGFVANAGYLRYSGSSYNTANYTTQFPLGLGLRIPVSNKVTFNVEGTTSLLPRMSLLDGPGDFYVGSQVALSPSRMLNIGASYGIISIDDSASVRILLGLNVLPYAKDQIETIIRETTKQSNTLQDCKPELHSILLPSRPLTTGERKNLKVLPFVISDHGHVKTTGFKQPTGKTKDGIPYVENSQIPFAIDLSTLPLQDDIMSVDEALLKMTVHRLVRHQDPRSGILCLINAKMCSGDIPTSAKQAAEINPRFFEGREPPNDFFVRSIQGPEKNGIVTANLSLPLHKLLENYVAPALVNLLYDHNGDSRKVLYFVVAPDIYVLNDVQLEVLLTIKTCTTSEKVEAPRSIEFKQEADAP